MKRTSHEQGDLGRGRRGRRGPEEETGLDQVVNVRLPAAEKAALRQIAFVAGLSVSALVRRRCWGRRVAIDPVPGVMEYLRRASVEIHAAQLHAGDRDRTHARAEAALGWLREAMNLLGQDEAGMGGRA
jgi:hypothetical protein